MTRMVLLIRTATAQTVYVWWVWLPALGLETSPAVKPSQGAIIHPLLYLCPSGP